MNTVTANKPSLQFLQEAHITAENICIHYTLYEINTSCNTHYAAEISTDEESAMQILSQNLGNAQQLFEAFTRHLVTPCTLSDILRDFNTMNGE